MSERQSAIPLPYRSFGRSRCDCGRRFWTERGYRGHYALVHILDRAESFRRWNIATKLGVTEEADHGSR